MISAEFTYTLMAYASCKVSLCKGMDRDVTTSHSTTYMSRWGLGRSAHFSLEQSPPTLGEGPWDRAQQTGLDKVRWKGKGEREGKRGREGESRKEGGLVIVSRDHIQENSKQKKTAGQSIPYMEMAAKRSQVVQSGRYFRNRVACRGQGMCWRRIWGRLQWDYRFVSPTAAVLMVDQFFLHKWKSVTR